MPEQFSIIGVDVQAIRLEDVMKYTGIFCHFYNIALIVRMTLILTVELPTPC
jgi:hypothetical protein